LGAGSRQSTVTLGRTSEHSELYVGKRFGGSGTIPNSSECERETPVEQRTLSVVKHVT
jgi:hypothetical protein